MSNSTFFSKINLSKFKRGLVAVFKRKIHFIIVCFSFPTFGIFMLGLTVKININTISLTTCYSLEFSLFCILKQIYLFFNYLRRLLATTASDKYKNSNVCSSDLTKWYKIFHFHRDSCWKVYH